jgi:hypothetical protein
MHVRFNPKKADKERTSRDVRFVPKADKRSAAKLAPVSAAMLQLV